MTYYGDLMKLHHIAILAALGGASLTAAAKVSSGTKYGDWEGTCQGNECGVVQVIYQKPGDKNTAVGRILLRKVPEANNQVVAYISLPLGVNLRNGLAIAVDNNQVAQSLFDFCDQAGCHAALPLSNDVQSKVKAGKTLQLAAFVGDEQQTMSFSLTGVTKAINEL